jgi:two-component system response regulator RegX3
VIPAPASVAVLVATTAVPVLDEEGAAVLALDLDVGRRGGLDGGSLGAVTRTVGSRAPRGRIGAGRHDGGDEDCDEKYVDACHGEDGMAAKAKTGLTGRPTSAKVRKPPRKPAYHAGVRVLVVEDEDAIAEPLAEGLRREGFDVERVATGAAALEAAEPDVVLLDLRLPDLDGFEVCRQLRARSDVPIIVVSARGEEIDRVVGLELGADDYVVKPFGLRELIARIRAVSRRTQSRGDAGSVIVVGALSVDQRARRVTVDGSEVELTPKEFDLLALLAREPGAVVERERILRDVWHTTWYGSSKTIDVHVAALRKKLGDPNWIETVRGVGLRLRSA